MFYHVVFSCSMTLTQTERGYPPAIEHIGKAIYIKNEMGKFLRESFMVWRMLKHLHDNKVMFSLSYWTTCSSVITGYNLGEQND